MSDGAAELRSLLGEAGAYREGHFAIADSQHVLSYYNCERLFQYPALASRAAGYLVERLAGIEAELVFTPSISALVLAFEIARRTGLQFVSHALPFTDPDYRFAPGTRLLVVEDVVVSGRSLEHARAWCSQRGAEIAAYAVLVDRRPASGAAFAGVAVRSVLRDAVKVYAPDACPGCRNGLPVVAVEPNYPERL